MVLVILVFGLEVCPQGPRMAAPRHGTSNGSTVVPRMVARGPRMAVHAALSFEVPFKVPGDKIQDQNFKFKGFINPSDQNEQYQTHTPLVSKI